MKFVYWTIGIVGLIIIIGSVFEPRHNEAAPAVSGEKEFSTVCIDGVTYIHNDYHKGYMTVKFNKDSKVELCDG